MFPTFTVPRVRMQLSLWREQLRGLDRLASTEHVIERKVRLRTGSWIQYSDTRLAPGESAEIQLDWKSGADFAEYAILVEPDAYYLETMYEVNATDFADSLSAQLWRSARDRARRNGNTLFRGRLSRMAGRITPIGTIRR